RLPPCDRPSSQLGPQRRRLGFRMVARTACLRERENPCSESLVETVRGQPAVCPWRTTILSIIKDRPHLGKSSRDVRPSNGGDLTLGITQESDRTLRASLTRSTKTIMQSVVPFRIGQRQRPRPRRWGPVTLAVF